jgi:purine-binding chemotaxis protein CheW
LQAEAASALQVDFGSQAQGQALEGLLAQIDQELARPGELAPAAVVPAADTGQREQHVVFILDGTDYAVPISSVLEIGRPTQVRPVPNLPDWVLGVANVRGDITSMVDLRAFLGLERNQTGGGQLMIVQAGEDRLTTGLIVDQVRGLRLLATEQSQVVEGLSDRVVQFLRGMSEQDGRLLALLDIDRLLLSEEMRQFELQ